MKLSAEKRDDIQTNDQSTVKRITLSANYKAFRLIFGQIYPDIIKAIVRELFTNAWDSQKMAGNLSKPIDIHLPSTLEPTFSIRDYGVGMTPEIIDNVYSKIFESTKDQSNDEAGMFGMGSKTPLGYTDLFSVCSYIDGVFWYYEIYLNTEGSPCIALKATGETDEENGVLVSLAVKEKDFQSFTSHMELFAFGANTPININRKKFLSTYNILHQSEDYEYVDSRLINNVNIKMGPVLYKLNEDYLKLKKRSYYTSDNSEDDKYWEFLKMPIIMKFEIGEFDVTGSREDLVYDDDMRAKIRAKMDKIIKTLISDVVETVESKSNWIERLQEIKRNEKGSYSKLVTFDNIDLTLGNHQFKVGEVVRKQVKSRYGYSNSTMVNRLTWFLKSISSKIKIVGERPSPYGLRSKYGIHDVSIAEKLRDRLVDYPKKTRNNVVLYYDAKKTKLSNAKKAQINAMLGNFEYSLLVSGSEKRIEVLRKYFGTHIVFVPVSNIKFEVPVRTPRTKQQNVLPMINFDERSIGYFKQTPLEKDAYYVVMKRNKLVSSDDGKNLSFIELIQKLGSLNYSDSYSVRISETLKENPRKFLDKNETFKKLSEMISKKKIYAVLDRDVVKLKKKFNIKPIDGLKTEVLNGLKQDKQLSQLLTMGLIRNHFASRSDDIFFYMHFLREKYNLNLETEYFVENFHMFRNSFGIIVSSFASGYNHGRQFYINSVSSELNLEEDMMKEYLNFMETYNKNVLFKYIDFASIYETDIKLFKETLEKMKTGV